jgi:hypothetical protein
VPKLNHTQKYQKDTQRVFSNTRQDKRSVVFTLKSVVFTLETTLAEALFLCRNECENDTPVFTVYIHKYVLGFNQKVCVIVLFYEWKSFFIRNLKTEKW